MLSLVKSNPKMREGQETRESKKRRALLAMVHIAKQELGLREDQYDAILQGFKVDSAADLSVPRLERMVRFMKHIGWKPTQRQKAEGRRQNEEKDSWQEREENRVQALQERVREMAARIENGDRRLGGILHKRFGVDRLEWLREAEKLRQVLAVLGHLKDRREAIDEG